MLTSVMVQSSFAGLVTFAHLPYTQCLNSLRHKYDVAVIGAPFDTGTTYRSGRFRDCIMFLHKILMSTLQARDSALEPSDKHQCDKQPIEASMHGQLSIRTDHGLESWTAEIFP